MNGLRQNNSIARNAMVAPAPLCVATPCSNPPQAGWTCTAFVFHFAIERCAISFWALSQHCPVRSLHKFFVFFLFAIFPGGVVVAPYPWEVGVSRSGFGGVVVELGG